MFERVTRPEAPRGDEGVWGVDRCRARMEELGVSSAEVAGVLIAAACSDHTPDSASALIRELAKTKYRLPAEVRAQLLWQANSRRLTDPAS